MVSGRNGEFVSSNCTIQKGCERHGTSEHLDRGRRTGRGEDIQLSLQRLGYRFGHCDVGEDAIRKAGDTHPDLILMDIVLKEHGWGRNRSPDSASAGRAGHLPDRLCRQPYAGTGKGDVSLPAIMLKPYQANELRTTIELALHRAQHDRHMRERLRWIATTVRCIGDGIVTTDRGGRVTYMNPAGLKNLPG